jgi:hypothetical protein
LPQQIRIQHLKFEKNFVAVQARRTTFEAEGFPVRKSRKQFLSLHVSTKKNSVFKIAMLCSMVGAGVTGAGAASKFLPGAGAA